MSAPSIDRPLPPARFSAPLTAAYRSDFDKYLPAFRVAWEASRGYTLDAWQEDLLRRIGELRPDGHLRYRQVLISMPRQQGKSELAAALGLWGLLRKRAALVIGIASSAEQARIIYERTQSIIRGTPALERRFVALTDTRGLRAKDGGRYEIKASKSAALQGLPVDLAICDEVHLVKPALWADLLNGTGSRDDCLLIGTTTAGDENSALLKHLYGLAESGEGGDTFGYFIWEAPEARVPEDDEDLAALLLACSPAYACGRVPIANVISDVRSMAEPDVIRYRLNRFVSAMSSFLPYGTWAACLDDPAPVPNRGVVFAIDRTPQWEYATITAAWKADGLLHTEVVSSLTQPQLADLSAECVALARFQPRAYVVDGYSLKALGIDLKANHGLPVVTASLADQASAASTFYAKTVQRKVRHPGDELLSVQLVGAQRKNVGESFRIARTNSAVHVDAVVATALAIHFAEVLPEVAPQLFV